MFMAVKTSALGAIYLSGDDADKFRKQITYGRPKKAANAALEKGLKLLREYESKGYALIKTKD